MINSISDGETGASARGKINDAIAKANQVALASDMPGLVDVAASGLTDSQMVTLSEYYANAGSGGGDYYWDANAGKADHDGYSVIDPDKAFPTDINSASDINAWVTASNTGQGCWVRRSEKPALLSTEQTSTPLYAVGDLEATANIDMGGYALYNIATTADDHAAATNGYVKRAIAAASSESSATESISEYTPTVFGGTTAGTATYATAIGRMIEDSASYYVTGRIEWSGHTGDGGLRISLPGLLPVHNDLSLVGTLITGGVSTLATEPLGVAVQYNNGELTAIRADSGNAISALTLPASGEVIFSIRLIKDLG